MENSNLCPVHRVLCEERASKSAHKTGSAKWVVKRPGVATDPHPLENANQTKSPLIADYFGKIAKLELCVDTSLPWLTLLAPQTQLTRLESKIPS